MNKRSRYLDGEEHLLWGEPRLLRIVPEQGRESVAVYEDEILMYCHPDSTEKDRRKLLYNGYYPIFKRALDELVKKWETLLNQPGIEVSIRLMRSEWGSCAPMKRRMTFNVDLVRLSPDCLEYVVIHEFSHLDQCNHSPAFWRLCEERLAQAGLPDSKTMRAKMKGKIWHIN